MIRRYSLVIIAALAVLLTSSAVAQSSFGTILGTVTDQTGAVVPNVSVQVKNTATGIVSTVKTTSTGDYTAINLVPGPYVVSVEVQGFQKVETTGTLVVNQMLRVNVQLHAGSVSHTVTVSATGTLLDTDSAAISQVISHRQIASLPLVSRNVFDLVSLSPGVVADQTGVIGGDQTGWRNNQLTGGTFYTGGNRGASNGFLLDGVADNDPSFQTPTITPAIDSVEAIRVMNQNYSAEFGDAASQINVETKSGTNAYHGEAFDFLRNDAFDATPEFSPANPVTGKTKPALRYNQFGAAVGGPIVRNHVFFYGSYQGLRSHSVSTGFGIFPTAEELTGNFSGQATIYDPATGLPFPGDQITTIDPKAQALIDAGMFAAPTYATVGPFNVLGTLFAPDNLDQYMVRIDAKLDPKNSLFVRFASSNNNYSTPNVVPFAGTTQHQKGKNIAVDYSHIFTPNFINDLRFGLNRPISTQLQDGANTDNIAGNFTGVSTAPNTWGAPLFVMNGPWSNFGSQANGPLEWITTDAKLADNVTWSHGAHTVQAGFAVRNVRFKEANLLFGRGALVFLGFYTANPANPFDGSGNAFADFLLGDTFEALAASGNYTGWYNSWGESGFVQDTWKATANLTLNLGLRYDYQAPFREEQNRVSSVDFNFPGGRILTPNAAAAAAANSPIVAYTPARDLVEPTKNAWQPRIGFSWRALKNTVVRGGYGVYFDSVEFNEYILPVLNAPFQQTSTVFGGLTTDPIPLDSLYPVPTGTAPIPGVVAADSISREHGKLPYVQQYNFNIQHEFPGDISLEVGYIGSKASRTQDRRNPAQGELMTPGDPSSIVFHYPNFGSILLSENNSSSTYNAFIARVEKRYSHGLSFLANYTYSKALGTASALGSIGTSLAGGYMNNWDPQADYGPLSYDITQSFTFSPIWDLPLGRGKRFGANAPAAVNAVIGGWQAQGIFTARTGYPFSIGATDVSGTNANGAPRADLVPGQDPFKKTPGSAFNINAFQQPAAYTFGNSGNNMMRGLGMNNTDFSLIKNTTLHNSLGFQLRIEAFNVFNQVDLGPFPGNSVAAPTFLGKYTSIQQTGRILQLGGKVYF